MVRALIIEDDESERSACAAAFELAGFVVATAADGKEGLSVLRTHGADVIVLDLLMPVLDGYRFLEIVAADPGLRDIPILVVTGADYDARLAGTAGYVKKPCRINDVVARARRWVTASANA